MLRVPFRHRIELEFTSYRYAFGQHFWNDLHLQVVEGKDQAMVTPLDIGSHGLFHWS